MVRVLFDLSLPLGRSGLAVLQLLSCAQVVVAARSSSLQSATLGGRLQARAQIQAFSSTATNGRETPVSRVVELLKAMQVTIKTDMEDDEMLYGKLRCWCESNKKEKEEAAAASETKLGQLRSAADGLKASQGELRASLAELQEEMKADKSALAEARKVQETQVRESTMTENELIQGIENLRAAIIVLSGHQGTEAPASAPATSLEQDAPTSLLALSSRTIDEGDSWTEKHEASHLSEPLEEFMHTAGFVHDSEPDWADSPEAAPQPSSGQASPGSGTTASSSRGFLQADAADGIEQEEGEESHAQMSSEEFMHTAGFVRDSEPDRPVDSPEAAPQPSSGQASPESGTTASSSRGLLQADAADGIEQDDGEESHAQMSSEDMSVVQRALRSASAFLQSRGSSGYVPAYSAQSGEVLGVLKQLKEEMERDLHAQRTQFRRQGATYQELSSSKAEEIQNEQRQEENKEDDLATAQNNLAETKEDMTQEELDLQETRRFLSNLEVTCAEAAKNFEKRKSSRMQEFQAVTEAVAALTQDEARDAMSKTYGLVQLASASRLGLRARHRAAATLKSAAKRAADPRLSLLAANVRLDPFVKVKSAIERMVAVLQTQQEKEVKKKDLCEAELHENDMQSDRTKAEKADLAARSSQLDSDFSTLEEEIAEARGSIAQQQLALQEAGKDRQAENLEYQRTVQDQLVTAKALKKALSRLQAFYREQERAAFVERSHQRGLLSNETGVEQVPQMKYKANQGAAGVMQLLAKLIRDTQALTADAKHSEVNAQVAYEQVVADTNAAVGELNKKVASKSNVKGRLKKEKLRVESDMGDVSSELEGLTKYGKRVRSDCNYLLNNFERRQSARAAEVDALRQATQILKGAALT